MNDTQRRRILTALSYGLIALNVLWILGLLSGQIPLSWGIVVLIVLLVILVWYTPSNYFYRRGVRYFRKNSFQAAVAQLTQSHLTNKKWMRSLTLRAHCLAELRDYVGGLADADQAIQMKPHSYEPYAVRAYVYYKMDDFQNALLDGEMAVRLKSKNAFALNTRGIGYLGTYQYEAALQDFNAAIRRKPKQAPLYSNRGMVYLRTGNMEAAVADFEKAMQLNPHMSQAYHNRGEYHLLQQNYPAALADFQKANTLNPLSDHAVAGLALTHFLMGNTAPAKNFWHLLVERNFNYADENWALAHLRLPAELDAVLRQLVYPS